MIRELLKKWLLQMYVEDFVSEEGTSFVVEDEDTGRGYKLTVKEIA